MFITDKHLIVENILSSKHGVNNKSMHSEVNYTLKSCFAFFSTRKNWKLETVFTQTL